MASEPLYFSILASYVASQFRLNLKFNAFANITYVAALLMILFHQHRHVLRS